MDQFIDDIAYKADLLGIDYVGIGIDNYLAQHPVEDDAAAMARDDQLVAAGHWRPAEYPSPPYKFPSGIETPKTLHRLTEVLLSRAFSEEEIRKILGLKWMRVYRAVWGG